MLLSLENVALFKKCGFPQNVLTNNKETPMKSALNFNRCRIIISMLKKMKKMIYD